METTGIEHQIESNPVTTLFFSKKNYKVLQKLIKKQVYIQSMGKFLLETDQDERDLITAMRAVYLNESINLLSDHEDQVNVLNNFVIQYIVPDMITQIKQEQIYLKEINEPIKPIPLPINVNNAKNSLPSITSVWQ